MSAERRAPVRQAALALLTLLAVSTAAYGALWWLDFGPGGPGPLALLARPDVVQTLSGLGEVTVALLGIAITVVAIIVELAANRYTPRITELFVRDPVNLSVLAFFVVTSVLVLWVDVSLFGPRHPTAMVTAAVGCMSASMLLLLPYFAYVFDFLAPDQVIRRLQRRTSRSLQGAVRGQRLSERRSAVLQGLEHLGELTLNSVDKNDKAIALSAVAALAAVAHASLREKPRLPAAWFDTREEVARDQDFVSLHEEIVEALAQRRCWVEMKVMRQYQAIFGTSLHRMRDVGHLVGMHTRRIASEAAERGDHHVVDLAIRFLNTYLRAAVNARDVRTAYNLLDEYRDLAEGLLDDAQGARVLQLAEHFKFYGQLAFHANLGFILETAAYDLCALIERAGEASVAFEDQLLDVFLELDREPEAEEGVQEASLRGVRKAQVKLATWYLARGDLDRARRIFDDMRAEKPARLRSIRVELGELTDPEYWEVSDRGINFDWLPPEQRAQLDVFFGWFEQVRA